MKRHKCFFIDIAPNCIHCGVRNPALPKIMNENCQHPPTFRPDGTEIKCLWCDKQTTTCTHNDQTLICGWCGYRNPSLDEGDSTDNLESRYYLQWTWECESGTIGFHDVFRSATRPDTFEQAWSIHKAPHENAINGRILKEWSIIRVSERLDDIPDDQLKRELDFCKTQNEVLTYLEVGDEELKDSFIDTVTSEQNRIYEHQIADLILEKQLLEEELKEQKAIISQTPSPEVIDLMLKLFHAIRTRGNREVYNQQNRLPFSYAAFCTGTIELIDELFENLGITITKQGDEEDAGIQ